MTQIHAEIVPTGFDSPLKFVWETYWEYPSGPDDQLLESLRLPVFDTLQTSFDIENWPDPVGPPPDNFNGQLFFEWLKAEMPKHRDFKSVKLKLIKPPISDPDIAGVVF